MKYSKILVINPFFSQIQNRYIILFLYFWKLCVIIFQLQIETYHTYILWKGSNSKALFRGPGVSPRNISSTKLAILFKAVYAMLSGLVVLVTPGPPIQMLPGPHLVVIKCLLVLGIELQSGLYKAHSTTLYYLLDSCLCIFLQ